MSYNFAGFPGCSLALSRKPKGKITNLEIPVVFSKKYVLNPHLFSGIAQFTEETNFWWIFCQCAELDHPFLQLLFVMTFSYKLFPRFHTKSLWCYAWAIHTLVRQLQLPWMPWIPFYGWGSTASRLEPLQGGSFFTTKFPEISGTHFIDIRAMKGWFDLGATQWFWTQDSKIGNPVPWPLDHCSLSR